MTTIRLHNTKTRKKEDFVPIDPENVRMYVCGPTVYDRAHLGNARPVVVFDVLYRLLRHVYGPEHVTYVRNITDVEDKIIDRARERGISIDELTRTTTEWFHQDMAALGVDYSNDPGFREPKATEHIGGMVAMISALIERGHAYAAEGHVLFRVRSYQEYGRLSGRSVDDMIAGARVEIAPYKEDPMDFVLWKPSTEDQPGWDSPWGRGRPGWHIECSAMALALLGESFDIHGGGIDLQFPHHENEIAQSCCAHPEGDFARYWLHNEMLQVEGKKMSKSLGNFFTVRDLLGNNVPGEVIRFVFLSTHYRKPMDWTEKKREEAESTLRKWRSITDSVVSGDISNELIESVADDLNTSGAMAVLHRLAREGDVSKLKASAQFLGLLSDEISGWAEVGALPRAVTSLMTRLLAKRSEARASKNWPMADSIRDGFKRAGIKLNDGDEVSWSVDLNEIDSAPFFHAVRAAFIANDQEKLKVELTKAREAGVHFSDVNKLDISPAWRGEPTAAHIERELLRLEDELEKLR